jgi:tetratricopeptide (TPR) repeat protein
MKQWPELKAQVNVLLARCHSQLMEPEMEREAYVRAVSANPNDLTAKLGWINGMVNQGNLEGAIKEYRALVNQIPQVRLYLARLLIATNRQRPAAERNWSEVEDLLAEAIKTMPLSIEPVVLTAELRMAQGNPAAARRELEKAKAIPAFSKNVDLRVAQAALAGMDGRFEEALKLLDQAQQELGDRVEFRLQRARLWSHNATQKGPQVVSALNDLAKNVDGFSEDERRKLLTGLAAELLRQQDLQGASRLWTQLAEHEPKNLEIRQTLLDLAFQTANEEEIRKNIDQIKEIDGNDEVLGRYCEVRYLIWQAGRATDKNKRIIYRDNARAQLNDLMSRSGNWSVIPLARGQLEEQELAEADLPEQERPGKEESIANHYLQAIRLGQRQPPVVRRAIELLFKTKRGPDALELVNSIPAAAQLAGDVGRQAVQFALHNRDFQRAQEIAQKAVAANPGDFQERLWLVRVLLESGEQARAETALREAVDLSKSDPDRWIALVLFMILTKQPDKAEQAIRDAETNLPKPQVALTMAQGCELIGRANETANREDVTKKWYGEAQKWYQKAQSDHPGDYSILRRQTEFYLRTKQMADAESLLADVLKRTAERSNTDAYAWAKRTLALTYASRPSVERMHKALALFEPDGRTVPAGQEGRTLADAEDLRILARVLDAQRTPVQLKRAIQILESLIEKNLANNEDRFLVGLLYEKSGDWAKAKEEYRALNFRTKNARDLESLNRRPAYLLRFAESALRNHPDAKDLAEIQDLVDELEQLQPQAIATLAMRAELYGAQGHPEKAAEIIKAQAGRSNLTPAALAVLANLAEKQNQVELAKQVYEQLAETPTPRGKLELAKFLGRQHMIKEALDVCEKLWPTSREPEVLAATCIEVLYADDSLDPAHLNRVSSWIEQAVAKPAMLSPRSKHLLLVGLGNIRERQGNYPQAEALYESAIKDGDRDGTSRNNLAWLIILTDGKRKGKAALDYINEAIELSGPRADFFDTRGVVYLNTGDLRLAIDDLEKAVALDPSGPKYFHLAQAYHEFKDKQKAEENLEKAKNKGLTPNSLHPLEQPAYDKLLKEYAKP